MKILHVSAGGRGERIAEYIASMGPSPLPKHLLPIPTSGKTLLGEIVLQAHLHFEEIAIWASHETQPQITSSVKALPSTQVYIDREMTGPLGPLVRSAVTGSQRTYGCAGDFFCNFSWKEFEKFHDSHGLPVSILVARSVPAPGGARFLLSGNVVTKWERVKKTEESDRINIGCYILDPTPHVIAILNRMAKHKEDPFFDACIEERLIAGYDPGTIGYNINVADIYQHLLRTLA